MFSIFDADDFGFQENKKSITITKITELKYNQSFPNVNIRTNLCN